MAKQAAMYLRVESSQPDLVSYRRMSPRTAQEPLHLEVERYVAVRRRQSTCREADSAVDLRRERLVPAREPVCLQRGVTGKHLITTIATESDFHMLSRQDRYDVSRDERRVA